MIERIVLDRAPDPAGIAARLALGGPSPVLATEGDGPNVLFVTASADRARAALARGSRAWTVGPTGELQSWDDLPLALALGGGTLADVRRRVDERLGAQGLHAGRLAWTPDGSVAGEAAGKAVYVTAGPDGEDPQVFVGAEAEAMARERGLFLRTLGANDQVAPPGESLASGGTHTLEAPESRRPRLERHRFSVTGE